MYYNLNKTTKLGNFELNLEKYCVTKILFKYSVFLNAKILYKLFHIDYEFHEIVRSVLFK